MQRQTCARSHLGTSYLSTSHAVKNGVFLTSRCLTTVNVPYPGSGVATLLICESPPYPRPCCFSSWDPWIKGTCWFLSLHPPQPRASLFPKAGPSRQEAGRVCRLYQITGCEQRAVRNWNEITKSIWFIWDLSLGLLGESECINPLWELIPCLVIIQASLKYALCWRSNQITLKNLEWEKCWGFFHQPKCLVTSVFSYLYCACHCGMLLYKQRDAPNLLLF